MAAHAQFTIVDKHTHNNTELIAAPTQVTIVATHTHNSINIDTKTNYKEENGVEKGNGGGDDAIASPKNLGLWCE